MLLHMLACDHMRTPAIPKHSGECVYRSIARKRTGCEKQFLIFDVLLLYHTDDTNGHAIPNEVLSHAKVTIIDIRHALAFSCGKACSVPGLRFPLGEESRLQGCANLCNLDTVGRRPFATLMAPCKAP